jgi:hypothetical protein
MHRLTKIALICSLGINFLSLSAIAQTVGTRLYEVTPVSADAYFKMADKPIGMLLVSPGCASCDTVEATIAGASGRHPNMIFIKEDATLFGQSAISEPAFGMFVPGLGLVYQKLFFHPDAKDVDAVLDERAAKAESEAAIVNQLAEVSDKMKDADAPFLAQLKSIDDEGAALLAPINGELKSLHEQIATLVKPHTDRIDQLQKKLVEATKEISTALKPLQEQLQTIGAPFKAQSDEIVATGRKANQSLLSELKAARDSRDKPRFETARVQLELAGKPYDEQLKTLQAKYEAASKQVVDQIKPLEKKGDEISAPILIEIKTENLLAGDDSRTLNAEIGDLNAQADGLTAPLNARATAVEEARAQALKPFVDELAKTKSAVEALVKADKP